MKAGPFKQAINNMRRAMEQNPNTLIGKENMATFNNVLQEFKGVYSNPLLMKISPVSYEQTILDLYIRISLLCDVIEGMISEAQKTILEKKTFLNKAKELGFEV